jgi:lycopene epsilon-cyclase
MSTSQRGALTLHGSSARHPVVHCIKYGFQCGKQGAIVTNRCFSSIVVQSAAGQAERQATQRLEYASTLTGNQDMREGSHEKSFLIQQANKADEEQEKIASVLDNAVPGEDTADVVVVGCGPAGLALASDIGARGCSVLLVGHDVPFVNNYGVWEDEFVELGLEHTLDKVWRKSSCYFKEGVETKIGRAYGRVNRKKLRDELLKRCKENSVKFYAGTVVSIDVPEGIDSQVYTKSRVHVKDGAVFEGKMVTLASGGAAGRFLKYEEDAPDTAAQTAYGIEAEVSGYSDAFDEDTMLFMDFRRHHTGLYPGTATRQIDGEHPNGGRGLWETSKETPSFLYAMPESKTRVFLEETCLVAKPALPFSVLKRRLYRRCEALGIQIHKVYEEEWSYIPTGGPLPLRSQPITAFGAAANLVHPATGYSIVRSLKESPKMADAVSRAIKEQANALNASEYVWDYLWSVEKRRQASFHIFGMELLCQLDVRNTTDFFSTFFALPKSQWEGFLASKLSSINLLTFALLTFALAPPNIKFRLVNHLVSHPAGKYLLETYTSQENNQ